MNMTVERKALNIIHNILDTLDLSKNQFLIEAK